MLSSNIATAMPIILYKVCKLLFTLLCATVSPWTSPFVVQAYDETRVRAWCAWLPWISRSAGNLPTGVEYMCRARHAQIQEALDACCAKSEWTHAPPKNLNSDTYPYSDTLYLNSDTAYPNLAIPNLRISDARKKFLPRTLQVSLHIIQQPCLGTACQWKRSVCTNGCKEFVKLRHEKNYVELEIFYFQFEAFNHILAFEMLLLLCFEYLMVALG